VVAFAALGETERKAIQIAWTCAMAIARHWQPAFVAYGLDSVTRQAQNADLLVYLGESSRFAGVAGEASREVPVLLIKSTVEELLTPGPGFAPRTRVCTGVKGIAQALAQVAPAVPSVDWKSLPWPEAVSGSLEPDPAECSYVAISSEAFRQAVENRGIAWLSGLPAGGGPFTLFLTMHDPAAATLADTALRCWPQCTVLASDGMVSMHAPGGTPWPDRLLRVRHWSARSRSSANLLFRQTLSAPLPDYDSAGMLFGAMGLLDGAFAKGMPPTALHLAGRQPGPLGLTQLTASGHPEPERIVVFCGKSMQVVTLIAEG